MQIVSVSPQQGSTDVSLTSNIDVVFDSDIQADSINDASIVVSTTRKNILKPGLTYNGQPFGTFDTDNFFDEELTGIASGTVSVNGNTVTFTPAERYSPNTTYNVSVSTAIQNTNGETLDKINTFSFTTREEDMVEPLPESYPANTIINSNVFFNNTDVNTSYPFYVKSTIPKMDSFLISSNDIKIKFNKDIKPSQENKISVNTINVLSDEEATVLNQGSEYTISILNNTINISIDQSINKDNKIIYVVIEDTFMSVDDESINDEYILSFISKLYPYFTSTKLVRLKTGTLFNDIKDIDIALNIYYSSVSCSHFNISPIIKSKFALYNSIKNMLISGLGSSNAEYIKKTFSEFSITISNKSSMSLYNKLLDEIDKFEKEFNNYVNFSSRGSGVFTRRRQSSDIGRLWDRHIGQKKLNNKINNIDRFKLIEDDLYVSI